MLSALYLFVGALPHSAWQDQIVQLSPTMARQPKEILEIHRRAFMQHLETNSYMTEDDAKQLVGRLMNNTTTVGRLTNNTTTGGMPLDYWVPWVVGQEG